MLGSIKVLTQHFNQSGLIREKNAFSLVTLPEIPQLLILFLAFPTEESKI